MRNFKTATFWGFTPTFYMWGPAHCVRNAPTPLARTGKAHSSQTGKLLQVGQILKRAASANRSKIKITPNAGNLMDSIMVSHSFF